MEKLIFLQPFPMIGKKKIAEIFHVNPRVVTEWVRDGAPFFLAGNKWAVEYSDLVRWLAQSRPARNTQDSEDE